MGLKERAQALEKRAGALVRSPAALILPAAVRDLIEELGAVVALLAERVEGGA